jgi:predicted ester cyclase
MTAAPLEEIFRGYLAACNDHDMDLVAEHLAERVLVNGAEVGRADAVRAVERMCEAFPDQHWEVERLVPADPWLTAVVRTSGVQGGGWNGLAPTGRRIEGLEIDVYRIDDGLVREIWSVGDDLDRFLALSAAAEPV